MVQEGPGRRLELGSAGRIRSSRTSGTRASRRRDTTKREQIYLRMQEIMEDTGAYVWLTFDPWFYVHRDRHRSRLRYRRRDAWSSVFKSA